MIRRPPISTRTDTPFPYTTLFRSVKAASQNNAEVGDPANDALRVDAEDLRVRAVGEGANLGTTQAARIAFSAKGGRINTDRSEEHTSELQSLMRISYAVFCLKKKSNQYTTKITR